MLRIVRWCAVKAGYNSQNRHSGDLRCLRWGAVVWRDDIGARASGFSRQFSLERILLVFLLPVRALSGSIFQLRVERA